MVKEAKAKYDYLIRESRDVLLREDRDERLAYIKSEHWIGYGLATNVIMKLRELLFAPKKERMPNVLIIGRTNNGKSMIAKRFCYLYSLIGKNEQSYDQHGDCKEIPVLYMQMPATPDIRRFYAAILHELGFQPRSSAYRISALEPEIIGLCKELKVKMIVIDEIHNVLAGRKDQQREFLNVLRFLGNSLQIPLICVGTKDAYLAIRSDDQLENRFEPVLLPAWKYDKEYKSLLASYVSIMPLKKKSKLCSPALAKKILKMSEGVIGEISTIITKSAYFAADHHWEEIDEFVLDNIDYKSPTERKQIFERTIRE